MPRRMMLAVGLAVLACCAARGADTVVICGEEFREALAPWVAHRRGQGHAVRVVPSRGTSAELREAVRAEAAGGELKYVVLIGDAGAAQTGEREGAGAGVPTHFAKAKVNIHWGSEPWIATDNGYADLDGDLVPEVAVGRLTADTPEELETIVGKILRYEQSRDRGEWRRRVHFVAGVGGFGRLADLAIETAAKRFITDGIPSSYAVTMTYGSWRSPYCPDPRRFNATALARLNEGCLFWVYIGHGARHYLDFVRVPGGAFPILGMRDVPKLECREGSPIAILLACHTGAFDKAEDCLAEELLRAKGGPVAVLCGSRVTMPYAMGILATGMMDEAFRERRETLGELVLAAKRRAVLGERDDPRSRLLDAMGGLLSPEGADLEAERKEHLLLFNLIGDPLLRIPHPERVELAVEEKATAGAPLEVSGMSPIDGKCTVELTVRRDRLTFQPQARPRFEPAGLAEYQRTYERANDKRLATAEAEIVDGRLRAVLPVPSEAAGPCHVRVFVESLAGVGLGAASVLVKPPEEGNNGEGEASGEEMP